MFFFLKCLSVKFLVMMFFFIFVFYCICKFWIEERWVLVCEIISFRMYVVFCISVVGIFFFVFVSGLVSLWRFLGFCVGLGLGVGSLGGFDWCLGWFWVLLCRYCGVCEEDVVVGVVVGGVGGGVFGRELCVG